MTFGNSTCVGALAGVVCYGVFFNFVGSTEFHPAVSNCSAPQNFDADITGIGVVISFAASAIICQFASIAASVLDNIAGRRTSILPAKWQPRHISDGFRGKCTFFRRILERLILNLADQQLVTGFALLIGAWVKLHSNPVLQGGWKKFEDYYSHLPNVWLPNAQFSLVVFLSMASSSSHLASVLVSREYMEDHRSQARLRLTLIIVFAMFLAVTIALASSFTVYSFAIVNRLFNLALKPREFQSRRTFDAILAISLAIPILITLGICWLCTLQLTPSLRERMQEKIRSHFLKRIKKWFRLSKIWHGGAMRLLPRSWRDPFTRFVKRCFWLLIIGHEFEVFILQNFLAILSLIWIALQRLATPPSYLDDADAASTDLEFSSLCSLHNVAGRNQWASFGQLLPMILLLLPVLSAYGAYIEERDKNRVTGYAAVPGWDWSPSLPNRRTSSRRPTHREESELSLLNSQQHPRHQSSGSVNSPFGRAHYSRHESSSSLTSPPIGHYGYGDGPSPVPIQSAFSPEPQNPRHQTGYFPYQAGFSSGVDEYAYPYPYAPSSIR